jgi:hypothetical protein
LGWWGRVSICAELGDYFGCRRDWMVFVRCMAGIVESARRSVIVKARKQGKGFLVGGIDTWYQRVQDCYEKVGKLLLFLNTQPNHAAVRIGGYI